MQTRVVLYLSSNLLLSMPSEGQTVRTAGLEGTGLNYLDELRTPSTAGVELIHPSCFAQRWALVVFQFQENPVMRTTRNTFIPFFPGLLKLGPPERFNPGSASPSTKCALLGCLALQRVSETDTDGFHMSQITHSGRFFVLLWLTIRHIPNHYSACHFDFIPFSCT